MYDQYIYKRSENLSLPLSVPHNPRSNGYIMTDQTFHTPSFGDEEFDIPPLHGQNPPTTVAIHNNHMQYTPINHSAPQMGMMNPAQDGLTPPGGAPSYQQPLYLQEPHTPISSQADSKQSLLYSNDPIVAEQDYRSGAPAGNYMIQQQPGGQQRLLMMQPAPVMGAPPTPATPAHPHGPIYGRSPQRASPPGATTSDDSDDSVHHAQLPGDAESLLPIHYCSATRQQQASLHQINVGNPGMKRPSPEPVDNGITRGQLPKKPKIQKKKKKRDPNEPQKPVSAYALFFRDTQAAIKGQNPNASFGEVSKIVASMWDGLDSEHKSVYKQKTEAAKKEYLKALAAYRASLVSKGGEQENQQIYNHTSSSPNSSFSNYYQGQSYNAGHSPQSYVPNSAPQGYSPQGYPTGQSPTGYGPSASPQGYQTAPGQSPQGYQGGQPQSAQPYQANSAQSPQSYPNPSASPQSYNPGQSPQYRAAGATPQGFPPQQSPQYAGPGHSPQAYRIAQSQSPPMPPPHSMQYHPHSQSLSSPQRPQHEASLHSSMQGLHSQNMQMQQQQALQQQHMQQQLQQQSQQLHQQQTQQTQQQQSQQQQQQSQQTQQSQPQQQSSSQSMSTQLQNSNSQGHNSNDPPGMSQRSTPEGESSAPSCIRQGCTNPAISSSEWEDEYCSNECVVSHCRDAFNSWVASNKSQSQNLSAVK